MQSVQAGNIIYIEKMIKIKSWEITIEKVYFCDQLK